MAAKTTWSQAPWLGNQAWLLKDNTVVQTPLVETTTSQRRVRVAGTTKSVPKGNLEELLCDAVKDIASQRGTEPWVQLGTPSQALAYHGSVSPDMGSMPDFATTSTFHLNTSSSRGHTDIVFEFESTECPTVTALVWVYMGSRHTDSHAVRSGITYRTLHSKWAAPSDGYSFWGGPSNPNWREPFSYYDRDSEVEPAKAFLENFDPVPGIKWVNHEFGGDSRSAVVEALKVLKQIVDVEEITLPVWRKPGMPEEMTYRFTGRTTFSNALYREMLDYVQTKATVERIRSNFEQILSDMSALGMVVRGTSTGNMFFEAAKEGFGSDLVCHMVPLTTQQLTSGELGETKISIVPDDEHTVSIDLASGTIVVSCLKEHGEEAVNMWKFARFEAELKGELDQFLNFARQAKQKRHKVRVHQIVKDRNPDEVDLEIAKFSA